MNMVINDVNPSKLLTELDNVQVKYEYATHTDDTVTIVFVEGTDMQLVRQIIDTHDRLPPPPMPTQDDFLIDLELRITMLELGISL